MYRGYTGYFIATHVLRDANLSNAIAAVVIRAGVYAKVN